MSAPSAVSSPGLCAANPNAKQKKTRLASAIAQPDFSTSSSLESIEEGRSLEEECGFAVEEVKHSAAATSLTMGSRPRESTLLSEIASFQIPDNVRTQAQEVARRLKLPIRRGKKRRQLLFYCLYSAYAELNIVQDPVTIATMVGIERSQIGRALSLFSEAQTGYAPPMHTASAVDFVPRYAEQIGLPTRTIGELVSIAQTVIEADSELAESYPQKVAAAIVSYYLALNNIAISSANLTSLSGFSEPTIKSVVKRVACVHNSIIASRAEASSSSAVSSSKVATQTTAAEAGLRSIPSGLPFATPAFLLFSSHLVSSGSGSCDMPLDEDL